MTEHEINAIIETYCVKVPNQLAKLGTLIERMQSDIWHSDGALKLAYAEAHRMSGAAYCMGFKRIGQLLGRLEGDLNTLQNGLKRKPELVILKVAKSWNAIGYEKQNVRPERSTLISRPTAPSGVGRRKAPTRREGENNALLRGQ